MTDHPAEALAVAIEKRLGTFHLRPCFTVGRGLLVLFGHSGSGKSLTLQAIAGLLRPDAGTIAIDGVTVFDSAHRIERLPQQRGIGMVVQSYALFPHLSVADNIAFGLHRWPASERRARVAELVSLFQLDGLERRRPERISGGQAQRVALARALAPRPRLLLLDEPFSALDSAIRVGLRRELSRLKRELDLTIVFVTHDLREAYNLADTIAVFDSGHVLQVGTRDQVFDRPASARVAELTEVRNIWHGVVTRVERGAAHVDAQRFSLIADAQGCQAGDRVVVCIRPERVQLLRGDRPVVANATESAVDAEIVEEIAHGASHTLYFAVVPGSTAYDVEVDLPALPYEAMGVRGQRRWRLGFSVSAVHLMPDDLSP